METKASYILVGIFSLALLLGGLGFVVWLAGREDQAPRQLYEMVFDGSVTGLRDGAPVRLNGVRVGEVVSIALDHRDPSRVRVGAEIFKDTPLNAKTTASLELEGLTGGRYILLSGGNPATGPLLQPPDQPYPTIPTAPSSFDQVLAGAPEAIANANLLLQRGQALLSDENLAAVSQTLSEIRDFSTTLADNRERIDRIVGDVATMTEAVRNTATAVEKVATMLQERGPGLIEQTERGIGNLDGAAAAIRGMSSEIEAMVAENREAVRDFSNTGLQELAAFLIEARKLVVALQSLSTEVGRDPARFLFGDQTEGYEPTNE